MRSSRRPGLWAVGFVALIAVVATAGPVAERLKDLLLRQPSEAIPAQFDDGGLTFEYPADWALHDQFPLQLGGSDTLAVIGTVPWGNCEPQDLTCHLAQRLDPGEIDVIVGSVGGGDLCEFASLPLIGLDPPRTRTLLRILGRPAVRLDATPQQSDYYQADLLRSWQIAARGSTARWYVIDAKMRGPGVSDSTAALDKLIDTLELPPAIPGAQGPVDCGPPFPP